MTAVLDRPAGPAATAALAAVEAVAADARGLWAAHAGDDLLVILGEEVLTGTGHWLALGIEPGQVVEWRYRVRDDVIDQHLQRVHQAGGLCVAAHPIAPYPSGVFGYLYRGFDAVEVWNGLWRADLPWNADNESALAEWVACWPLTSTAARGALRWATATRTGKADSGQSKLPVGGHLPPR